MTTTSRLHSRESLPVTTNYRLHSHESLRRLEQYQPINNWYWDLKRKADTEAQSQPVNGAGWPMKPLTVDLKLFRE